MAPKCLCPFIYHLMMVTAMKDSRSGWSEQETFLFTVIWKCNSGHRGSHFRCGWWHRNTLFLSVAVAVCWFSYLCLCCLCILGAPSPASSSSSWSIPSKQTGLSWHWQPVQIICFYLLLSGCSWIILPDALCNWGSSDLPQSRERGELVSLGLSLWCVRDGQDTGSEDPVPGWF